MKISLQDIGKRYNDNWIFRHINFDLETGGSYAILGSNGSGKSTLLKVIAGYTDPSEGSAIYILQDKPVPDERKFSYLSLAAPNLSLIEDFTLAEMVNYQARFKGYIAKISTAEVVEILGLADVGSKYLKQFSTGMLQRLKIGLAILTSSSVLFLDEPVSNLDKSGIDWYMKLMAKYSADRTIIICSNRRQEEYQMCKDTIEIEKYK